MEEKEEEYPGRDQCGAHTHSLTLTHSLRARRARSHAGSPGARRTRSAAEKLLRLLLATNCFGKCICSVAPPSLWNPVLAALEAGNAGRFRPRDCRQPR